MAIFLSNLNRFSNFFFFLVTSLIPFGGEVREVRTPYVRRCVTKKTDNLALDGDGRPGHICY